MFKLSLKWWALVLALGCPVLSVAGSYEDILQAIEIDDFRTVSELLKRGVDVDTVNPKGESLLMLAARSGKPAVIKTLLAAKPKLSARNAQGENALMLAAINGRAEVVRMLLDSGADPNQSG